MSWFGVAAGFGCITAAVLTVMLGAAYEEFKSDNRLFAAVILLATAGVAFLAIAILMWINQ